ncbi:MAG: 30S ribosomal protein S18 [Bdellovibrionales bacterium]
MKNFLGNKTADKKKQSKGEIFFDYKNPIALYDYIEGGKISPARTTNLRHKEQKQLRNAIKKARNLGLVPISHQAYDNFGRKPELISPKSFSY